MSVADYFTSMDYGPAPEDDSAARAWLEQHATGFGHFIDGAFRAPPAGEQFDSLEPATGRVIASIAQGDQADIDAAVDAAASGAAGVAGAGRRGSCAASVCALRGMVQRHSRLLAVLESMDNGKPIRESRDIDIPLVARHFLSSRGLGAVAGSRSSPSYGAAWRRRADHSVEFSAADVRVEGGAGAGGGQYAW